MTKSKIRTARHRRSRILANFALIAGVLAATALFAWTVVNPRHLPSNTIYLILFADYMAGLALFVILLVRMSAGQPLDDPTTPQLVHWESDFQSWNTSLGIRLLATDQQLRVLRRLFDLGNRIDNSVSPPRLDETKRHEILELIRQSLDESQVAKTGGETQVLFSGLHDDERYHVTAILRDLRKLGNPALIPRIFTAPTRGNITSNSPLDLHFEEIRATAPQCVNVLSALAILHADQDTLLRASSASAAAEQTVLLRPAVEAEAHGDELLRSVNRHADNG